MRSCVSFLLLSLLLLSSALSFAYTQSPGRWDITTNLSVARFGASGAALSALNMVTFMGGQLSLYNPVMVQNVTDEYGDVSGARLGSSTMPIDRTGYGYAELGGLIYLGAGFGQLVHPKTIDSFDGVQWSTLSVMLSDTRLGVAAGGANMRFVVAGGFSEMLNNVTDLVEIVHLDTMTITNSTLSAPRRILASVTFGPRIYFAGGLVITDTVSSTNIDVFNTLTMQFEAVQQLSVARFALSGAIANGVIAFAGGDTTVEFNSAVATVDLLNTTTGIWTPTLMPGGPRSYLAVAGVGMTTIYALCPWLVFAGGFQAQQPQSTIDIYDTSRSLWVPSGPSLAVPRAFIGCATVYPRGNTPPYVLFAGGLLNGGIPDPTVDIFIANVCQPPAPTANAVCNGTTWLVNGTAVNTNITIGNAPVIITGDIVIEVIVIFGNSSIDVQGSVEFSPTSVIVIQLNDTISTDTVIPVITSATNISGSPDVQVDSPHKCLKSSVQISETSVSVLLSPSSGCGKDGLSRKAIIAITVGVIGAGLLLFALAILFYMKRNEWTCVRIFFRRPRRQADK